MERGAWRAETEHATHYNVFPVIQAYGLGESRPYWTFAGTMERVVRAGYQPEEDWIVVHYRLRVRGVVRRAVRAASRIGTSARGRKPPKEDLMIEKVGFVDFKGFEMKNPVTLPRFLVLVGDNGSDAQIILTTHSIPLLHALRREEIMAIVHSEDGISQVLPPPGKEKWQRFQDEAGYTSPAPAARPKTTRFVWRISSKPTD